MSATMSQIVNERQENEVDNKTVEKSARKEVKT